MGFAIGEDRLIDVLPESFRQQATGRSETVLIPVGEEARPEVLMAVANFDSLGCQLSRAWSRMRASSARGRRNFHVPSDHFTRYGPKLLRSHAQRFLHIEEWSGVSLLWGMPGWGRALKRVPTVIATRILTACDALARGWSGRADVIVVAGRPRRSEG